MNGMISFALVLVMMFVFLARSLTFASLVDSSASKSNSFVRHQFVSQTISHLEAVEDYHIVSTNFNRLMAVDKMDNNNGNDKEWSHHWQTTNMAALSFPLVDNNNNKKNNNGNYHSMSSNGVPEPQGHFYSEGRTWFEPFPSTIEISFKVFGVSHHYHMKVKRDLFSDDVGLKVDDKHYKYMRATYTADAEEVGTINDLYPSWAVVTLDLDGRFTAVVCKNGTVLNIDPSDIHLDEIAKGSHEESQLRVKDAKYNPHAMLAYHISLKDADFASHLHGTIVNRTYPYPSISIAIDDNSFNNNSTTTDHSSDSSSAPPPSSPSPSSSSPSGRRLLMSRWTNCFPNDSSRRTVRIGVATDTGYFIRQLSRVSRVQNAISSVIASVNNVFGTQINVDFRVDDTVIKTRLDGDAWNNLGGSCRSMETELDQFTQWRTTARANSLGLWTLFTDCTNIQGVIGIAYIGGLCMRGVSTSLANFGPPQWVTLAHELGHNFGATHPFATNTKTKGDWGGLMDYGSHKIKGRDDPSADKGEYAFASTPNSNARTNKDEICSLLSTRVNINSWPSYLVPYNECWVV